MASLKLPTIVFACKSDLERRVEPKQANAVLDQYDVGLIEVTTESSLGKDKIRTAFEWIFKAIFTQKRKFSFTGIIDSSHTLHLSSQWCPRGLP